MPIPTRRLSTALLCSTAILSACGNMGPSGSLRSSERVSTFGANPQFDNERYEMVDLITLLDPKDVRLMYRAGKKSVDLFSADGVVDLTPNSNKAGDADARRELAMAEQAFYDESYGADWQTRRNRIQDRLIGASNQRCAAYKVYLNRFDAYQQTSFGISTTVLGGASAIVGGLKDARILGGLAGISSGSQAEIAQGFLGNLASYVIVPGIELRRKAILEEINQRRSSTAEYTLQAALADTARYHGACTLVVGLEQAKEAIQTVENPGMRMMAVTLNNVMQTRAMQKTLAKMDTGTISPEDLVIPSFRINDAPVSAAVSTGGARLPQGFGSVTPDSPESVVQKVVELGQGALKADESAAEMLKANYTLLEEEEKTPTQPALKASVLTLKTQITTARAALDVRHAAVVTAVNANAVKARGVESCLRKLHDAATLTSDVSIRKTKAATFSVAVALVNNSYTAWIQEWGAKARAWSDTTNIGIHAASFENISKPGNAEVSADDLGKALNKVISGYSLDAPALPDVDFKTYGVTCPS